MSISPKSARTPLASSDKKCTVYYKGGMGIVRKVVKRVEVECGKYAQFNNALFVTYREPRQRRDRCFTQTDFPSLLIVEGVDTPEPASMWGSHSTRGGVTTSRSRYSSCDPRWQSDFDGMIDAEIAAGNLKVVFDGRKNNPYTRTAVA